MMRIFTLLLGLAVCYPCSIRAGGEEKSKRSLSISGTRFLLDGKPFPYTGVSFFNAVYNPAFNASSAERKRWLGKFRDYGVNVLRVWAQWDSRRGFADAVPGATLYEPDGRLREAHLRTLR